MQFSSHANLLDMTIANGYRALADPTRREILRLLREGDLPAGELASQFEISWPSVSRHLRVLEQAGLVESRRSGGNIIYALRTSVLQDIVADLADLTGVGRSDPESGGGPRSEVGHQHIGTVQQPMQQVQPGVAFHIERDRLLAPVRPDKVRSKPIHDIVVVPCKISAFGIFHFDDPRTKIGEHPGADRRRDRLFQCHHRDSGQRPTGL